MSDSTLPRRPRTAPLLAALHSELIGEGVEHDLADQIVVAAVPYVLDRAGLGILEANYEKARAVPGE